MNNIAHKVEQEVLITVFFDKGTTNKQIKAPERKIKARPEVEKLSITSADEAWENIKSSISRAQRQQTDLRMTILLQTSKLSCVYRNDITKQSELVLYRGTETCKSVNQSEEAANTGKCQ